MKRKYKDLINKRPWDITTDKKTINFVVTGREDVDYLLYKDKAEKIYKTNRQSLFNAFFSIALSMEDEDLFDALETQFPDEYHFCFNE